MLSEDGGHGIRDILESISNIAKNTLDFPIKYILQHVVKI